MKIAFIAKLLVSLHGSRISTHCGVRRHPTEEYLNSIEEGRGLPRIRRRQNYEQQRIHHEKRRHEQMWKLLIPLQESTRRRPVQEKKQTISSSEHGNFHLVENIQQFNFSCVGGYHDLKIELLQTIDFFHYPGNYTQYGVRIPRGVLLEGPPGNGKTLIAKCLAGECNLNFISTSGSEFNEKYVGVGASRIRELFRFAEQNQPTIIFIDEIDALGRSRSGEGENSNAERDQTLNQLLVMMDGFSTNNNKILIMGATNRADMLDPAILRPGRFDKIIHVPNPDTETRKEIIDIHVKSKPINVSTPFLVKSTRGFNGAQIENILNEAVLYGIRTHSIPVNTTIIEMIKEKILVGRVTLGHRQLSETASRRIAIHEVGHLLMALQAECYDTPWKITIDSINPNTAFGYTIFEKDEEDEGIYLREYFVDQIKVLLGGRVAEEVYYGESISSGALSDLENAFEVAKKMVMNYGMGSHVINPFFSENYKKRIDEQIHLIISRIYQDTKLYLTNHKHVMDIFVNELLLRRTLHAQDIQDVYRDIIEYKK